MNLTDLPDIMRTHSEHDPVPVLAESRLDGVRRKVVATYRRRVAGAFAGVVAIVMIVGGAAITHHIHGRAAVVPAASSSPVKMINGFPEYAIGGKLIGTRTGSLAGPLSLTFTPTALGFVFSDTCTVDDPTIEIDINISIGPAMKMMFSCSTAASGYASEDPVAADRITPGSPTAVTFSPTAFRLTLGTDGEETSRKPMAVPAGSYSVAMWQKVPFGQYPLPPRPKKLPVLDVAQYGLGNAPETQTVYSDPANPLAPRTITFTMPDCAKAVNGNCNQTAAASQTPGYLHIAVNGVTVNTASFWDYTGGGSSFDIESAMPGITLHPGELVTVTITPEHVTGAWVFAVAPGAVR